MMSGREVIQRAKPIMSRLYSELETALWACRLWPGGVLALYRARYRPQDQSRPGGRTVGARFFDHREPLLTSPSRGTSFHSVKKQK
jgi:hypothetical protein